MTVTKLLFCMSFLIVNTCNAQLVDALGNLKNTLIDLQRALTQEAQPPKPGVTQKEQQKLDEFKYFYNWRGAANYLQDTFVLKGRMKAGQADVYLQRSFSFPPDTFNQILESNKKLTPEQALREFNVRIIHPFSQYKAYVQWLINTAYPMVKDNLGVQNTLYEAKLTNSLSDLMQQADAKQWAASLKTENLKPAWLEPKPKPEPSVPVLPIPEQKPSPPVITQPAPKQFAIKAGQEIQVYYIPYTEGGWGSHLAFDRELLVVRDIFLDKMKTAFKIKPVLRQLTETSTSNAEFVIIMLNTLETRIGTIADSITEIIKAVYSNFKTILVVVLITNPSVVGSLENSLDKYREKLSQFQNVQIVGCRVPHTTLQLNEADFEDYVLPVFKKQ